MLNKRGRELRRCILRLYLYRHEQAWLSWGSNDLGLSFNPRNLQGVFTQATFILDCQLLKTQIKCEGRSSDVSNS